MTPEQIGEIRSRHRERMRGWHTIDVEEDMAALLAEVDRLRKICADLRLLSQHDEACRFAGPGPFATHDVEQCAACAYDAMEAANFPSRPA